MSWERYAQVVAQVCAVVDFADGAYLQETRPNDGGGLVVRMEYFADDTV